MFSSLRDRYGAFRDRFGTAGLLVAVIALIAVAAGTAVAAGGLTSQQKKEVKKIAKKFAGKPGAPGLQGPQGVPGAAGANGKDGTNGADGESVTVNAYEGEECATEEGAELTNDTGTAYVCNGEEGEPWTAGGTLPAGATETGSWLVSGNAASCVSGCNFLTELSFPIPLSEGLTASQVKFQPDGAEPTTECPGSASEPKAGSGFLCIYEGETPEEAGEILTALVVKPYKQEPGAGTTGGFLVVVVQSEAESIGIGGTWAVTG